MESIHIGKWRLSARVLLVDSWSKLEGITTLFFMSEELATALSLIAFVAFIVIIIMGLTETEQGTFAERGKIQI